MAATITSIIPPILTQNNAAVGAAAQSMAELAVAGGIGAACVKQQLLTPQTVRELSKTTFSILLPMFLGTSIFNSVKKYGLNKAQAMVPIMAILQCGMLYLITTNVSLPLFGVDSASDDGRGITVCSSFGNGGVVPVIFCESLFRGKSDMVSKSIAYVSLYLTGWSPFFWGFGRYVLLGNVDKSDPTQDSHHSNRKEELFRVLKTALPPPVVGVFIGLLVAISPLSKLFLTSSSGDRKAPLAVVLSCIAYLGRSASPLSLLILVSSLAMGIGIGKSPSASIEDVKSSRHSESSTKELSLIKKWTIVSASRFVLSPALMYGLLALFSNLGFIEDMDRNPFLWFVLMLEATMPPAQNQTTMLQVVHKSKEAGEMAKFLFVVYATSMIPVVIIVSAAMQKFGLV